MTAPAGATTSGATGAGGGSRGRALGVVALVAVALLVLVAIGLAAPSRRNDGPPLDPTSTGPAGTRAAVELAEALGADVTVTSRVPGDGTDVALMFEDLTTDDAATDLLAWVEGGRTLVVADPVSALTPEAAYVDTDPFADTTTVARGRCDATEPGGLDRLGALVAAGPVARFQVPAGASSCFEAADGAVVVVEERGAGRLVSVGSPWLFTNEVLDQGDDAGLLAALAVPEEGTRLAVLVAGDDDTGLQPADGGSLSDALPTGVGLALLQLLVAFVVYALYRARRLGRPVPEDPPVAIAGSELVRAVGGLLEHAGARDRAAQALRRAARRRLAAGFGLPAGAGAAEVVDAVAARTRLDHDRLASALHDGPVAGDAELAALGRELDAVVDAALRPTPSAPPPGEVALDGPSDAPALDGPPAALAPDGPAGAPAPRPPSADPATGPSTRPPGPHPGALP